jgi:tetratricopeptide (TPR) repeat protein
MAKKVASAPTQAEAQVGEMFSRSEKFVETYKKHILTGAAIIVLLVIVVLAGRQYYFIPMEHEAQDAIFMSENHFANQEWALALNGDSVNYAGFLAVADEYGLTATGKLASAYAGLCYYHLGNYEEAEKYLSKYSSSETVFSPAIKANIGDCYAGMGKIEEAIKYFKSAASAANDEILSPFYLKKAATAYETGLQDYKNALEIYTQIKNKYPSAYEAQTIDKYIERAKILLQK